MISQTIASMTGSTAKRIIEDDDVKPMMRAIVVICIVLKKVGCVSHDG